MIGIILLILKIIGIILLVLLGLILLTVTLVLFVPIKYQIRGHIENKVQEDAALDGKNIRFEASVRFLNPFIRVSVIYPNEESHLKIKVFGFSIYTKNFMNSESADILQAPNATQDFNVTKNPKDATQKNNDSSNIPPQPDEHSGKLSKILHKLQNILHKIQAYLKLWQENKELIKEVLITVLKALKTLLPTHCDVHGAVGTGQADTTGYIYAAYCSLLEVLPKHFVIELEPIWLEKNYHGRFRLKGHVRLIHLIVAAFKIIADKKVRKLYKKIRSV